MVTGVQTCALPICPQAYGKANSVMKTLLAAYEPPALDSAVVEELEAFVARRKAEGGVATDY